MHESNLSLPNLYNENLDRLIESISEKHFYPMHTIFSAPGDEFDGVYYIKSGRTKHYMTSADGVEKVLYTLSDGWLFGEAALYLGRKTGLYSKTEMDTVLYKIPPENFFKLIDESRIFRDTLIKCIAHKLFITRYEIENITFNPCKERIIRLLCSTVNKDEIIDGYWYDVKSKYTHYEISVIVGAARETVSKMLNELMREGEIRTINRRLQFNIERYEKHMSSFSRT